MRTPQMHKGVYAILRVQLPADSARRAGILLVDHLDRVYLKLSETLFTADLEIVEIWALMMEHLLHLGQEMGGHRLIKWLEETASHFLLIEITSVCIYRDPEIEADRLFSSLILAPEGNLGDRYAELGIERFGIEQIRTVMRDLPTSPVIALRMIESLKQQDADISELESFVNRDPALAAQVIRLSNVVRFSRGMEIRSIRQALMQIGVDVALGFLSALVLRPLFSSPSLQRLWNDSVLSSSLLIEIGRIGGNQDQEELRLLGLLFNIGKIVFAGLPAYELRSQQVRALGFDSLESEQILCGTSHADVGAELLAKWGLAPDFVEAIRFHHMPSRTESQHAALLFLVENRIANSTSTYDLEEYECALNRLGISASDLNNLTSDPSTEMHTLYL